ncbi:MAG: serine/threonine-protein kinase [Bradymonadia bacterium]
MSPTTPEPLTTLGRYQLIRRLASGGMGEVYLGELKGAANFSRQVAIKRILPHLAKDQAFVARFIDEANVMVQLHHGNIVSVQELVDEGGELFLVMDYLPGRDLKALIKRLDHRQAPISPDMALYITAEVLSGLDYAHHRVDGQGAPLAIVHRDVSPANVLLGAAGEVKLTDFGVARARGGVHQSVSGALQGKFVYMSPEQADGQPLDHRSDIFSVGLVLYELLTGARPFAADTDTEILRKVRTAAVEPPSTLRADLPPEVDSLVMKALERDPGDRFTDAAAFQIAIRDQLAAMGSTLGARALADVLAQVFPEGVVPTGAADRPMSIDDALLAQLEGPGQTSDLTFTTGSGNRSRTFTLTGEEGPVTPGTPTSGVGAPVVSVDPVSFDTGRPADVAPVGESSVEMTPPKRPFYRLIFAGTVLGGALTAGLIYWPSYAELYVDAEPAHATLTLGDVRFSKADLPLQVRRRTTVQVCATAEGYQQDCDQVEINGREVRHTMTLAAKYSTFSFDVTPKVVEDEVRILVDERPTDFGYDSQVKLSLNTGHTFTLQSVPEGYTFEPLTMSAQELRDRSDIPIALTPKADPPSP